jgi:hypothetical protein
MYSFPQAAINNRERDSRIKNRDLKKNLSNSKKEERTKFQNILKGNQTIQTLRIQI